MSDHLSYSEEKRIIVENNAKESLKQNVVLKNAVKVAKSSKRKHVSALLSKERQKMAAKMMDHDHKVTGIMNRTVSAEVKSRNVGRKANSASRRLKNVEEVAFN